MCTCFLNSLVAKKAPYIPYFLGFASPKPRYLRCCLLLVAKTTVFTVFCGQHLAKTLVFTQFSACCKKYSLHAKSTKTLQITVFWLLKPDEKRQKTTNKCPKWSFSFKLHKPEVRHGIFGALPSQALASPSQTGPNQSLPPPHPLD